MQDAFENWMDVECRECGGEWFDGKVVGVAQPGRQAIIAELTERDELILDPEPENPFDRNAIAVRTSRGDQVGYLDKRLAEDVTRRLKQGMRFRCYVRCLRPGPSSTGLCFGLIQHS